VNANGWTERAGLPIVGSAIKLFLPATDVRTGKIKVFTDREITADCVLASARLPFLYQAVEVDGSAMPWVAMMRRQQIDITQELG